MVRTWRLWCARTHTRVRPSGQRGIKKELAGALQVASEASTGERRKPSRAIVAEPTGSRVGHERTGNSRAKKRTLRAATRVGALRNYGISGEPTLRPRRVVRKERPAGNRAALVTLPLILI